MILELAAPPLTKPHLHERVDFFINAALVHRSFIAWAQERLHDQFLYTYHTRPDEHACLERRLTEAGFGPTRSIQRLYLDVSRLLRPGDSEPDGFDSEEGSETSATSAETASSGSESSQSSEGPSNQPSSGHGTSERASFERTLSPLLAHYVQGFDTLWLMPTYIGLDLSGIPGTCRRKFSIPRAADEAFPLNDAAPRLLEMDNEAFRNAWDRLHALPLSQRTTLVLRNTVLVLDHENTACLLPTLVLDRCRVSMTADVLHHFPDLETLIVCKSIMLNSLQQFDWLTPSARHVHFLQSDFEDVQDETAPAATFPALESLTLTWLQSDAGERGNPAADVADPLHDLRNFVEATIVAPQCTFKYLRSTKAPEDALADAMAALGLDSS